MLDRDQTAEIREQKRIARKYRLLGYDVLERPNGSLLPDFMQGMAPDIIARSLSDNVVIEVKRRAALEGSNDLVSLAERVSDHRDWRFELVVLDDADRLAPADFEADGRHLQEKIRAAVQAQLEDVAYVYIVDLLVGEAQNLAARHRLRYRDRSAAALLSELAFRGVVPSDLSDRCLEVLAKRHSLVAAMATDTRPSEADLVDLIDLYDQVRHLS